MPGKRQHYISRFALARFRDPTDDHGRVWRTDKHDHSQRLVAPKREAALDHYYRIVLPDGTVRNDVDDLLTEIETAAAPVIEGLADRDFRAGGEDVYKLLRYIVALHNRTPQAREALEEVAGRRAEMQFEVLLSDPAHHHAVMSKTGRSSQEIEAERRQLLAQLHDGTLRLQAPAGQGTAMMVHAVDEATDTLFDRLGVTCVRAGGGGLSRFVLSDHPVSHYDPEPKFEEAAAGFLSSAASATWVPLDPTFGLLLTQQRPGTWTEYTVGQQEIDELNVQTYAWARDAIYTDSQDLAVHVCRYTAQHPELARELRYRPARVWVTRSDGSAGVHRFESRFGDETATADALVTEQGVAHARRNAWPPQTPPAWGRSGGRWSRLRGQRRRQQRVASTADGPSDRA